MSRSTIIDRDALSNPNINTMNNLLNNHMNNRQNAESNNPSQNMFHEYDNFDQMQSHMSSTLSNPNLVNYKTLIKHTEVNPLKYIV